MLGSVHMHGPPQDTAAPGARGGAAHARGLMHRRPTSPCRQRAVQAGAPGRGRLRGACLTHRPRSSPGAPSLPVPCPSAPPPPRCSRKAQKMKLTQDSPRRPALWTCPLGSQEERGPSYPGWPCVEHPRRQHLGSSGWAGRPAHPAGSREKSRAGHVGKKGPRPGSSWASALSPRTLEAVAGREGFF